MDGKTPNLPGRSVKTISAPAPLRSGVDFFIIFIFFNQFPRGSSLLLAFSERALKQKVAWRPGVGLAGF